MSVQTYFPQDIMPEDVHDTAKLDGLVDIVASCVDRVTLLDSVGILPPNVVQALFDRLEERSIQSDFFQGFPVRFFVFHIDEAIAKAQGTEQFYRAFAAKLADFIRRVPEYASAQHMRPLIAALSDPDFSKLYGKYDSFQRKKPLMDEYINFASNLVAIGRMFFANPGDSGGLPRGFPKLIPVFNFTWPPSLDEGGIVDALDLLQQYSAKVHIDKDRRRVASTNLPALTDLEIRAAESAGPVFDFVSKQVVIGSQKMMWQIIASPLYPLRALGPMELMNSFNPGAVAHGGYSWSK